MAGVFRIRIFDGSGGKNYSRTLNIEVEFGKASACRATALMMTGALLKNCQRHNGPEG